MPAVTTSAPTAPADAAATRPNTSAVVITVDGQIDDYTRVKMFRRFDQARALGAKTVILQINTTTRWQTQIVCLGSGVATLCLKVEILQHPSRVL